MVVTPSPPSFDGKLGGMTTLDEPTTPEAEAEAQADNSMYPAPVEAKPEATPEPKKPAKQTRAKPKPKPREPYAVVGRGDTDEVLYSRAVPLERAKTRKSLTVHHLQRRLAELGYPEAGADLDGRWGALTGRAVAAWQKDAGHEATGDLTQEQFAEIFSDDINVTIVLDFRA